MAAARALAPQIAAAGDRIEHERRLPPPLVEAMAEAGLFRMLLPRSLGGGEVDIGTFTQVVEEVAKADASTAWCLSQSCGTSMVAAYLDEAAARAIFGDPRVVLASGTLGQFGVRAVVVDGGYRVTGRWVFGSGCTNATWLGGGSLLYEPDGSPRRRADESHDGRMLLFPASEAEIIDTWHVSGLCGTGSHEYAVTDLFVPEVRAAWMARDSLRQTGPLYVFPLNSVFAIGFASVGAAIRRKTRRWRWPKRDGRCWSTLSSTSAGG